MHSNILDKAIQLEQKISVNEESLLNKLVEYLTYFQTITELNFDKGLNKIDIRVAEKCKQQLSLFLKQANFFNFELGFIEVDGINNVSINSTYSSFPPNPSRKLLKPTLQYVFTPIDISKIEYQFLEASSFSEIQTKVQDFTKKVNQRFIEQISNQKIDILKLHQLFLTEQDGVLIELDLDDCTSLEACIECLERYCKEFQTLSINDLMAAQYYSSNKIRLVHQIPSPISTEFYQNTNNILVLTIYNMQATNVPLNYLKLIFNYLIQEVSKCKEEGLKKILINKQSINDSNIYLKINLEM